MLVERFNIAEYQKRKESGTTEFTLEDGTIVRQAEVGKGEAVNYLDVRIPPPPDIFQQFRRYYSSGSLKLEGLKFHSGMQYGVWTEYEQSGKIKERIDHEAPFGFSFEDMLSAVQAYHRAHEIPKVDILDRNTTIAREVIGDEKYWYFSWEAVPGRIEVLKFDGHDGELIEKSHYELMDN